MNIGSATLTILGVVLILFGASARNRSLLVAPSSANRLTQQSATDPELIVATHQSPKSADFRDDIAIQHILPGPATPRHTSDRRRLEAAATVTHWGQFMLREHNPAYGNSDGTSSRDLNRYAGCPKGIAPE